MVDPFGIYPVPARPGFNAAKAGQHGHDRLVKAYAMVAQRPDVVLLGTSRVQYGLDPSDPVLAPWGTRAYNAGLLGGNVYAALRYLQHAQAVGAVRLAVVGLEPLMFDDSRQAAAAAGRDFLEARLRADAEGAAQLGLAPEDLAATLLSWDALRLSLRTVRRQDTQISDLLANGQRAPEALRRYFAEAGSTRANFVATEEAYFADYAAAALPGRTGASAAFDHLAALFAFARAHQIALVLYFTPQHARLHEVARQAGAEASVDAWQARVAEQVALANAAPPASAPQPPIELWNMAALTALACEEVPAADAGMAPLAWFWESTHARDRLGHLLLTRMLAPAEARVNPAARAVGEPARVTTLAGQQAASAAALTAWARAHPDDVAEIAAARARVVARARPSLAPAPGTR